jgi:hypothetical protein
MLEKLLNNCYKVDAIQEMKRASKNNSEQEIIVKILFNTNFELQIIVKSLLTMIH